jgi:PKD repeat protein
MKILQILSALFMMVSSVLFITGCKKDTSDTPQPVANFTFTGDHNPAPCAVTFSNSSTNATSYKWNFGDGSTSTEQNPQHIYTTGGTFNVILVATGAGGSNSANKNVTILFPVPGANFTFTGNNNPAPCVVTFTNTSTNSTSYLWDFGDGTQTSTNQSPQHTYTTGGTFNVQLTSTGAGGTNSITKSVAILYPVPIANFTFTGDNNPAPCVVTFTNISTNATTYSWSFGDGGSSTAPNPQYTYTTGGTFTVQLTATGPGGYNSISKILTIQNPVLSTNVTFNNPIYTDIYVTLNGITLTITPGGSVTFYSLTGSSVSYSAYTYGTTNIGSQIGLELDWNYTINLPGGNISYNLITSSSYFFLFMVNEGSHNLTPLYVNYGLSDETVDYILIPDDGVEYSTGYYDANENTEVLAVWQD